MEKTEEIKKKRARIAAADGMRKEDREAAEEDEVEELLAILGRMRGAFRYFKRASGGEGGNRGSAATWKAFLEIGAKKENEAPEERCELLPDLIDLPEESGSGDGDEALEPTRS
ncbi:hypothetical protein SAY86_016565 [Trapa natans]|uniref:Uncharacterized protein n=1 Tax=Trapa natans TaxID=22666 RepID=A0AAN7R1J6_TRANT|nr:hypothetical protein SAY86_016565 [Trapa natans]